MPWLSHDSMMPSSWQSVRSSFCLLLTAVESGGGRRGLRRSKLEAHRRAALRNWKIGASAPISSRLAERLEECDPTWSFGKRSGSVF